MPRLAAGAIPSQFAWTTAHETRETFPATPPIFASTSDLDGERHHADVLQNAAHDEEVIEAPNTSSIPISSESADDTVTRTFSFENLALFINVPSGWSATYIRDHHPNVFVISNRKIHQDDPFYKSFTQKEIYITPDLTLQVNVLGEKIDLSTFNVRTDKMNDTRVLNELIVKIDQVMVCSGSHKSHEILPNDCPSVKRDIADCHRHVNCPLVIAKSTTCALCQKARKTIARRLLRVQHSNAPQRFSTPLSPVRRRQWSLIKSKLRIAQRKTRKLKTAIDRLRSELSDCRNKMSQYKKKTLLEHVKSGSIPTNQMLVIHKFLTVPSGRIEPVDGTKKSG